MTASAQATTTTQKPGGTASVTGTWYEEGQPNDPNVLTVMHLDPSGRFDVHFRMCHGRDQSDDVESGMWLYDKGVLDIVTLNVNGLSSYRDDKYDTVSLSANKFVYRHEATGYVFSDIKVDAKSEVPSCDSTS